jgi:hypothetical protein
VSEESAEARYFRAIEETFIRLRGTPFLLSPADWRVARRWQEAGLPVERVCRSLERFFERRRERGARGKVQSLRYCAPAVESDWRELGELAAPGRRGESEPLPIAERLRRLLVALPPELPGRASVERSLEELIDPGRGPAPGSAPSRAAAAATTVEDRLEAIEGDLLENLRRRLGEPERREIAGRIDEQVGGLATRLSASALEQARSHLWREAMRRQHALPVLSLFSPQARGESGD